MEFVEFAGLVISVCQLILYPNPLWGQTKGLRRRDTVCCEKSEFEMTDSVIREMYKSFLISQMGKARKLL